MVYRTPEDSDDPGITLLLNDNPLDDSSDFINHVSRPVRKHSKDDGRSYGQVPLWTRAFGSFVPKLRNRSSSNNSQNGFCVQCERRPPGRKSWLRWCMIWFLAVLIVLLVFGCPCRRLRFADALAAVWFKLSEYLAPSFPAFYLMMFMSYLILGAKLVIQVLD